jgi:hypothetical protein
MVAKKKNIPDIRFYDEDFLAQKLGADRRKFHREIKPIILSDYPEIVSKLKTDNPDIGLDSDDNLYLATIDHKTVLGTGFSIFDYI